MNTAPQSENPYASPQSEEAPVVSNPTPAWRDGELVVVAPDGELPRRCAKCGGEASGGLHYAYLPKPEPINWRRGFLFGLIAFSLVAVMPIVAGILSTKMPSWPSWIGKIDSKHIGMAILIAIAIGLPTQQLLFANRRRLNSLRYSLCWWHNVATRVAKIGINLIASFWMIMMAVQPRLAFGEELTVAFLVLFFLILSIASSRIMFTPKEIARRNELVWLKGAGPAFRDSLPEFPPELAIKQSDER